MSKSDFEWIYLSVKDLYSSASSLHRRAVTEDVDDRTSVATGLKHSADYFYACGVWFEKEILPRSGEVAPQSAHLMKEKLKDAREAMLTASQFDLNDMGMAVDHVYRAASNVNSMFAELPTRHPSFPYPPILGDLPGRPTTPDDPPVGAPGSRKRGF